MTQLADLCISIGTKGSLAKNTYLYGLYQFACVTKNEPTCVSEKGC